MNVSQKGRSYHKGKLLQNYLPSLIIDEIVEGGGDIVTGFFPGNLANVARKFKLKPAAHKLTCRAYLLFLTSWINKISLCVGNIYGIFVIRDKNFLCAASKRQSRLNRKICACVQLAELKTRHELVILIHHVAFNSASCTHAQIFLFRHACRLLAAHKNFLSRMTKNIKHV